MFHLALCPLKLITKSVGFLCLKIDQDRKHSLHFGEEYNFSGKQPVNFFKNINYYFRKVYRTQKEKIAVDQMKNMTECLATYLYPTGEYVYVYLYGYVYDTKVIC